MVSEALEWNPKKHERSWFTHITTGDLGYLVRREGKDAIRLDRPGVDEIRPFTVADWIPKSEHRPMSPAQLAQIAFEADRGLCRALGMFDHAKQEWLSLSQEKKKAWIEVGPSRPIERKSLYAAIMKTLGHLAE